MVARLYPEMEQAIAGYEVGPAIGHSLARAAEAHPALAPLLDYAFVDPAQIAIEIGMVSPYEEDGVEDLNEIDLGPTEWFEPSVGLTAVQEALRAVRATPQSIAQAIYDPGLRPEAVLTDLEAIEQALLLAQQHETRFHFRTEG